MNSQTRIVTSRRPALRMETVLIGVGVLALVLAPFYFYPIFIMKVLCFALFACAFNLLLGYTGILSFGHAAFFGGGAYFTAHAVKEWGLTPELGILVGVAGAALLGLVIGFLAIRRQGIYSTMITLALSQMFFFFCLQAPFTHGEDGIQNIPRGRLFGLLDLAEPLYMYFFVLTVFLAGLLVIWRVIHSPYGRVRTSEKFPVGLFDWVQVETGNAKTAYRVLIEKHGRLVPEERSVPKEPFKLSKITKKTAQAKKTVTLTGNDAETWNMAKTDIRVNDSVRWTFHNRKIADTFKLEKGNTVLIVGGERRGGLASIVDIVPGSVTRPALVKLKPQTGDEFQTTVNNVFVIGNANAKTDW